MTQEELNKICEWLDTNITCMYDDTRIFFIERFRKAMDAVVKEPLTWHKCSDELPKTNGRYIVQYNNGYICTMPFSLPDYWRTLGHQSDIKYWMELPNPVKD